MHHSGIVSGGRPVLFLGSDNGFGRSAGHSLLMECHHVLASRFHRRSLELAARACARTVAGLCRSIRPCPAPSVRPGPIPARRRRPAASALLPSPQRSEPPASQQTPVPSWFCSLGCNRSPSGNPMQRPAVSVTNPDPHLKLLIPLGQSHSLGRAKSHFDWRVGRRAGDDAERASCDHIVVVSIYDLPDEG
jgi:hypothetical protein